MDMDSSCHRKTTTIRMATAEHGRSPSPTTQGSAWRVRPAGRRVGGRPRLVAAILAALAIGLGMPTRALAEADGSTGDNGLAPAPLTLDLKAAEAAVGAGTPVERCSICGETHMGACPLAPAEAGWYADWQKFKADLEKATGTTLCLCAIGQNMTLLNGPEEGKNRSVIFWNLHLAQKLWPGARLVTNTRGGRGHALNPMLGTKLDTNWMGYEPRALYVSHCYLEQKLLTDRLTLMLGKLDTGDEFDTNEVASWNFLSYSLARNPTIPCRWHALGAVARYEPVPWLYVQAGLADAQGSWTETGFRTALHDEDYTVSLYEVGVRPKIGGRPGNYRFILWHNTSPVGRVDGLGSKRDDVGFGVSFDQAVTDRVTAFFRYGWADEDVREMAHFWSTGFTWTGPIPQREKDVLGFGVSQGLMGRPYRRANRSASAETLFELYYRLHLTDWCSLAPHAQVILNPGANKDNDVGVTLGLRLQMVF